MSKLEGWGLICLVMCLVLATVSLTMLSGASRIAGCVVAVLLGVLAGGLYAASVNAGKR